MLSIINLLGGIVPGSIDGEPSAVKKPPAAVTGVNAEFKLFQPSKLPSPVKVLICPMLI